MIGRDKQTYKTIISNLINGMSCGECPYEEDCPAKDMDILDAIDYPCSELMFIAERRREKNGKN